MAPVNKCILLLGLFSVLFLGSIAAFNYSVDPMCYYHCDDIDLSKPTQNVYYQSAQTAVANVDAEILVVGSSRGETTPPLWIQEVTGLKTVNLSQAGGDLLLKVAVLNAALEKGSAVKKVIWIADYFELVRSSTDIKVRITPALQKYMHGQGQESWWKFSLGHLQRLIDHNSFEASLEHLKNKQNSFFPKSGNGGNIDYVKCQSPDFEGETDPAVLEKKIFSNYRGFVEAMTADQDDVYWKIFENQLKLLDQRGVEVILLVPPVHNAFRAKMDLEHPKAQGKWANWIQRMESLTSKNIRVVSYLSGIPGDNGTPSFWNDGVHMTCKSVILMLRGQLSRWGKE